MSPGDLTYKPGPAFDLEEAQDCVADDEFALGKSRAQDPLLDECDGQRKLVRPAAKAIFAALDDKCFVETVRLLDLATRKPIRYDVYGVEITAEAARAAGVETTRWYVKFTLQEVADKPPVFIVSMHPAEHWPVLTEHELAKRRAR